MLFLISQWPLTRPAWWSRYGSRHRQFTPFAWDRWFENVRKFGQIAQSVERGLKIPVSAVDSVSALLPSQCSRVGLQPGPLRSCAKNDGRARCVTDWSRLGDFDSASRTDFQDRCTNRWGEVRSNLVARELEDARGQCREARAALEQAIADGEDCDLMRATYID